MLCFNDNNVYKNRIVIVGKENLNTQQFFNKKRPFNTLIYEKNVPVIVINSG